MKIAYVTGYDLSDKSAWSGLNINILRSIQSAGIQTELIGYFTKNYALIYFYKVKSYLYGRIFKKRYFPDREPRIYKNYAAQADKTLASINYDIVFSPGTIPGAYLKTKKPFVFWTDATFAGMIDFYPSFSNLCYETIKKGNEMEQLALSKCRLAIYSSEWAANTAVENYDVDPEKVKVVPFGGNIICNRNEHDIELIAKYRDFNVCRLLFVGVEWFRKGGDIAVKIAERLIRRGIRTELHVVGCNPGVTMPDFVKLHGFISKESQEGIMYLDKLFTESLFLLLPSRAECCAVVLSEASSYGLPSLATNVGGIPSAIKNGRNGQTFQPDEGPDKYCDYIERLMSSKKEYEHLAHSSFKEYTHRLNWKTSGKKVYDLIQEFCG